MQLRYSSLDDDKVLAGWLQDSANWRYLPIGSLEEADIFAKNWIGFARYRASLTGVLDSQIVALGTLFLMPYKKVAHSAMLYLIVDAKFRKKGIGQDLLRNLINLAEHYFHLEEIVAEIYEGSSFVSLLKKEGFEQFAYQENYIKDKGQYLARILLQKRFNP